MGVSQTVCGEHKAKSARLGGLTLALTVMAAPIASAATFTYGSYSVVNDINVTISAGSGSPALPNGFEYGYFGSGQIVLYGSGPNINQTLDVWCVDATHILQGSDTYTVVSPTTNNGGVGGPNSAISNLGEIGALVNWGDANINSNNLNSAATQLAIWMIEYPGATFTSDSAAVNALVPILVVDAQTGAPGFAPSINLGEVVNPLNPNGNQGLIFGGPVTIGTTVTPVPAALPLLASGLGAMGLFGWRRKRKSAALAM
jgi:hypothetical protein